MTLFRFVPIIVIGGGFLICRAIFMAFPLRKGTLVDEEYKTSVILTWIVAFLIIVGQLIYIWRIFERMLKVTDPMILPLFLIPFVILGVYAYFLIRR